MDLLEELTKEVSEYLDDLQIDKEEYRITGSKYFTQFSIEINPALKEIELIVSDTARMAIAGGLDNYFALQNKIDRLAFNHNYTLKTPRIPQRTDPNQLSFRFHHNME
tara:strand:+ start:914 stop:1237 length:324 start_codon:yes stop_codon:yes gene_type:complete